MLGWHILAWICSSVLNFSCIFFCSICVLTTFSAKTSDLRVVLPSKQTAKPPLPSFLPVMYVSGAVPGSVTRVGGRHLSSILSGLCGFSSCFSLTSAFGFFVVARDFIGTLVD